MNQQFKFYLAGMAMLCLSAFAMAEDHPAQTLVVESTTELMEFLKTDADRIKADPAYLQTKVQELVVPHLHFPRMTRSAVGKHWKKASDDQKRALVSEFKNLMLNTYSNALLEYSGETIEFEPYKSIDKEKFAVVRSNVRQSGGGNVPVLYKLTDDDGWRIYDVEVSSVSLVTSFRTAFSSEVSKGGIDGLIATLKDRNSDS
jgi:phospholipid transport system substrate-binding protein